MFVTCPSLRSIAVPNLRFDFHLTAGSRKGQPDHATSNMLDNIEYLPVFAVFFGARLCIRPCGTSPAGTSTWTPFRMERTNALSGFEDGLRRRVQTTVAHSTGRNKRHARARLHRFDGHHKPNELTDTDGKCGGCSGARHRSYRRAPRTESPCARVSRNAQ